MFQPTRNLTKRSLERSSKTRIYYSVCVCPVAPHLIEPLIRGSYRAERKEIVRWTILVKSRHAGEGVRGAPRQYLLAEPSTRLAFVLFYIQLSPD